MSKRIKLQRFPKITPSSQFQEAQRETISFSFQYVNKNKSFGYGFLTSDKEMRQNLEISVALIDKLQELSNMTMIKLHNLRREKGVEQLPFDQFSDGVLNHLPDDLRVKKMAVIRFNKDNCRIIGSFEKSKLMIFAFDFNFTAYKH
jgi:hypothetical protein